MAHSKWVICREFNKRTIAEMWVEERNTMYCLGASNIGIVTTASLEVTKEINKWLSELDRRLPGRNCGIQTRNEANL